MRTIKSLNLHVTLAVLAILTLETQKEVQATGLTFARVTLSLCKNLEELEVIQLV
jgi:hypothetical protein